MAIQIAELRRCPTCRRWGGKRRIGADGVSVELDSEDNRGPCREGPWHGSLRGPRNACGQWLRWEEIRPAEDSAVEKAGGSPCRAAETAARGVADQAGGKTAEARQADPASTSGDTVLPVG